MVSYATLSLNYSKPRLELITDCRLMLLMFSADDGFSCYSAPVLAAVPAFCLARHAVDCFLTDIDLILIELLYSSKLCDDAIFSQYYYELLYFH